MMPHTAYVHRPPSLASLGLLPTRDSVGFVLTAVATRPGWHRRADLARRGIETYSQSMDASRPSALK